jgi:hypothetical protein
MTESFDRAAVEAAMASHFDTEAFTRLLKDVVAPLLSAAGYRRGGSAWRKTSALGDVAVIQVRGTPPHHGRGFIAGAGVTPAPWWDWVNREVRRRRPTYLEGDCVWSTRIVPTEPAVALGGVWRAQGNEELAACFDDVARQLAAWAVPRLDQLLDRESLLMAAAAEFGNTEHGVWTMREPDLRALLFPTPSGT